MATMYEEPSGALFEVAAAPLHPRLPDAATCLAFDAAEEGLWAGTESGLLCQLAAPTLERYATAPAHAGPVLGLRSVGAGAVSASAGRLCLHASGGMQRLAIEDEAADLTCVELDPGGRPLALAGHGSEGGGGVAVVDLAAGCSAGQARLMASRFARSRRWCVRAWPSGGVSVSSSCAAA